jgi:DnaJ-domain-containing protein 1
MQIKIDNKTDKMRVEEFLKLGKEIGFVNIFDKDKIYKIINYDDKILQALRLFGLDNYKDKSTLKRRYKELVLAYHPDRVANKDTNTINKYTRKFQHIQQAYETLKKAC